MMKHTHFLVILVSVGLLVGVGSAAAPVAQFTANDTSGAAPLGVAFTDQSTGATTWYWDFGDAPDDEFLYLKMDDLDVTDSSSNGFSASTNGLLIPGAIGNAIYLNGSGSYISTQAINLTNPEGAFSFAFWVNKNASGWSQCYLADSNQGTNRGYIYTYSSGGSTSLTYQFGKTDAWTSTSWSGVFTDYMNTWTHIAIVADYNTDFVTLYRNGVSLGDKNISGALFPNTNRVKYIGRYSSSHTNLGNMSFDDYRIYNRSISQEEITALYQSGLQNPEHTYTSPGTYSVSQTVWNSDGSDTELKTNYITVGESLAPVAAFTADHTSICPGDTVTFTDESTNTPTEWYWDFGDFNTSILQSPSHTYAFNGLFSVALESTNAFGSDWENKTEYIGVGDWGECVDEGDVCIA